MWFNIRIDYYFYLFLFGLKFLYIWIIMISMYLGYLKNTFWNWTLYRARQDVL